MPGVVAGTDTHNPHPAQTHAGSLHATEQQRLHALLASGLLDSGREPLFDEITELAATLCRAPVCLISLVDRRRLWFKAVVGLSCRELPREGSVCAHTVLQSEPLIVPDLLADPRFAESPLVRQGDGARFYAGIPLHSVSGEILGALCVIDVVPRTLTPGELHGLAALGRQAEALIAFRHQVQTLEAVTAERWSLAQELRTSEERFRTFMDHSPTVAYIKDADGCMRYYNRTLATLYGVSREAWLGKSDRELWPAEMAVAFRDADLKVLAGESQVELEERTPRPDGGVVIWKSYKFPFVDGEGRRFLAGISIDITSEKRIEEELRAKEDKLSRAIARLEELSLTDALTGVNNRRYFDTALERDLRTAHATARPLSLLLLDIDHFKRLNDRHGHAYGDTVLRQMGKLLSRLVRHGDQVCRVGGEEFAILLPATLPTQALALGRRICAVVAARDWGISEVTASVGVASSETPMDPSALTALADQALYAAKHAGRNQALPGTPEALSA